ncbi:MAG: hypothetical protein R2692_06740 [Microbacterium sp.]
MCKVQGETVTYAHPKLEPVLERTRHPDLLREQLMQMGMAVGDLRVRMLGMCCAARWGRSAASSGSSR